MIKQSVAACNRLVDEDATHLITIDHQLSLQSTFYGKPATLFMKFKTFPDGTERVLISVLGSSASSQRKIM
jgi:hypothetical protein